jgi:hypothetical protein
MDLPFRLAPGLAPGNVAVRHSTSQVRSRHMPKWCRPRSKACLPVGLEWFPPGNEIRDVVQALPAATPTALAMCGLACGVGLTNPRDVRLVGLSPVAIL